MKTIKIKAELDVGEFVEQHARYIQRTRSTAAAIQYIEETLQDHPTLKTRVKAVLEKRHADDGQAR